MYIMLASATQSDPVFNLILHLSIFVLLVVATILSLFVWRMHKQYKISHLRYVGFISFGLFFYTVSEGYDIFTPFFGTGVGFHNYVVELILAVSLAMIFIGFRRTIKFF